MAGRKISEIAAAIALLFVAALIFFNPYADSQNLHQTALLCGNINAFCAKMGLGYRFYAADVAPALRFSEYFLLGIAAAFLKQKFSGKMLVKNLGYTLFFGLCAALGEMTYRRNGDLGEIQFSFVSFCAGVAIMFLIYKLKRSEKSKFKYNSNKYAGRR